MATKHVDIDLELSNRVERLVKRQKFKYKSKRQFINLAVYEKLEREGG